MPAPFSEAFLAGDPRAEPFLPGAFRTAGGRRACVERARARRVHPDLLGALRGRSAQNAAALSEPGTVAVVTGQQVGLFLGPLYSVYKAATAIVCARALAAETGVRCVPVFWLQTEDHDFAEIDHCHALGPNAEVVKVQLNAAPPARTSVKHAVLGPAVGPALDALEACVGATEAMALMRACYRPEVGVADAFADGMAALFEGDGLVLVDPRAPALAHAARPIHTRAIADAVPLAQALEQRSAALNAAGFEVQVAVRRGAPLSFFHPDGAHGPRFRLEPTEGGFGLVGREGRVTAAQLAAAPDDCFSTSALLRPILQDTLLPTAGIVGGPGELNYFAQLQPLYAAFGLPMPMAVPRARFRVIAPRTKALLAALGLSANDAAQPEAGLRERLRPAAALDPAALEQRLTAAAGEVLASVPTQHEDVADAVKRTRATIARAASRLAGRYGRSLATKDAVLMDRVRRVQSALVPNGEPQERVLSLAQATAHTGLRPFIEAVLAAIDPWAPALKDLG